MCFDFFQLDSPIKAINVKGQLQTSAPYRISIQNLYDNIKPINAEVVLDPSDTSLDASINYDIGTLITNTLTAQIVIFPVLVMFHQYKTIPLHQINIIFLT